jgi:hypothetical protein
LPQNVDIHMSMGWLDGHVTTRRGGPVCPATTARSYRADTRVRPYVCQRFEAIQVACSWQASRIIIIVRI